MASKTSSSRPIRSASTLTTRPARIILIMAGGTGGHVMPALAVADRHARGWLASGVARLEGRHGSDAGA